MELTNVTLIDSIAKDLGGYQRVALPHKDIERKKSYFSLTNLHFRLTLRDKGNQNYRFRV